jgi:hypothetical protein
MSRTLPALTVFGVGLIVLLDFFFENPILDKVGGFLLEGAIIVGAFALLLGLWNLLLNHEERIRRRKPGWGTSVVILLTALASMALGLIAWRTPAVTWFYRYLLFPLEASAGALLAFVVVGAAARVWRLNSWQGGVLLLVGLVVLLGSLPVDGNVPATLAGIRDWIIRVPVLAAVRGLLLGVALGIVATGLRALLWVDRPYE